VPKRLARTIRRDRFEIRRDSAFGEVIRKCAATGAQRNDTWINPAIVDVFEILHARGFAHSIETWEDGTLAGGLYGLAIGGAFFGESMFSLKSDASKVALVHLAARLKFGGFRLLDAQFPNPHLDQFGAVEIGERAFEVLLERALECRADFYSFDGRTGGASSGIAPASPVANGSSTGTSDGGSGGGASVLQVITQTS
jgi:leucyl/phenylalanyl-tRNA--protein transferase